MVFNYGLASQMFGALRDDGKRRHAGIDLGTAKRKGVPVGCPLDGCKVLSVAKRGKYGNTVEVETSDGNRMLFAHLANPIPKHIQPGVEVNKGDWLADVGRTGGNYAIHLHFEYKVPNGKGGYQPVNPVNNKYHSFTRADFEETTLLAMQQKLGKKGLVATKSAEGFSKDESQMKTNQTWTLDRGYDQPSWWERHAPSILGGWSKERLNKAQEQKERDEEIFQGIKVGALLDKGVSRKDIAQIKSYIKEKSLLGQLNNTAMRMTDIFKGDQETAKNVFLACKSVQKDGGMV